MKRYLFPILFFYSSILIAQSVYAPLNSDYYYLIDRYEIKSGHFADNLFTSSKPYLRKDIASLADTVSKDTTRLKISRVDRKNLKYLQDDNWEWSKSADSGKSKKSFLKIFYPRKNSLFAVNEKNFMLQANPVVYFLFGAEKDGKIRDNYLNSRGVELRGAVDNRVGFYFFLTDNQAVFPTYVNKKITATGAVPGEGFWKAFKSNGYDFFDCNGSVNFNFTKHISTQFGQDKNFIGNGYRSLLLSDNSSNYLFWKIDTKVWHFQYTNIYAEMVADNLNHNDGDVAYPRKYMALHYLTWNVSRHFNIGVFESITFGNTDSIHKRNFDLNYLNPIILYTAVENGLGSSDKDHLGFDMKLNFAKHFSLYGTVFIDEFLLSAIRAQNGWWGNKQAAQIGMKYIDAFGIRNLDFQGEVNAVRPYTYTHFSFSQHNNYSYYSNYSNYDQALADPLGANFYEFIGIMHLQPFYKLSLTGKIFYDIVGLDSLGKNFGGNVMLPYTTHVNDYGNFIGQGARTTIKFLSGSITYQLAYNMFVDLNATIRLENSLVTSYNSKSAIVSVSFRWNIAKRLQEF